MEQHDTLSGMLDLISEPAFYVSDGAIAYANQSSRACLLTEGAEISALLATGAEEYAQFRGGSLYLTVHCCDTCRGACVTRIGQQDVFVLEPQEELSVLQGLALAAQELRMPLSNVMLTTDQLFPQLEETASEQVNAQMARINRGLFQLLRLVCNMSDAYAYTLVSSNVLETVNICDHLEEMLRSTAELTREAGISLHFQNLNTPVYTQADSALLQRAVSNLISNAIKFTPKGGRIDVKLARKDNMLYLTVQDSGSCVPENLRSHIFSRYQRTPEIGDSRNGLGLGLVLVRTIATIHGGTVLLEYPQNSGTRITMTLSIRQSATPMVKAARLRIDYAGERDHQLLELADVLPHTLYNPRKIN